MPLGHGRQWIEDIFGLKLPDADDLTDIEESHVSTSTTTATCICTRTSCSTKEDESRNVPVAFVLHNNILFSTRDEELPVFRLQRLRASSNRLRR